MERIRGVADGAHTRAWVMERTLRVADGAHTQGGGWSAHAGWRVERALRCVDVTLGYRPDGPVPAPGEEDK